MSLYKALSNETKSILLHVSNGLVLKTKRPFQIDNVLFLSNIKAKKYHSPSKDYGLRVHDSLYLRL